MKKSEFVRRLKKSIMPPPRLKISEWADKYRRLSPEASAEPGRWHTSKVPYFRDIMDVFADDDFERIVVQSSAQLGKTEFLLNVLGFYIHLDPSPILFLQPTLSMAESFSKDRLAPMLRDSPCFAGLVSDPKSRDGNNSLLYKKFPGGQLTIAGANSPASLASRPIRIVLADEVDRYPPSAGTEGDPLMLALRRTDNFFNRKIIIVSTPTQKGTSRIEKEMAGSDQRSLFVSCLSCGFPHKLEWSNVKVKDDNPFSAVLSCPNCEFGHDDALRLKLVEKCFFKPAAQSNGVAGFYLNSLASPWRKLWKIVDEYQQAKDSPEMLKTWINTTLGESYEDAGDAVTPEGIFARLEDYEKSPNNTILTAGVDIQQDRFEVSVWAWGQAEECWLITHEIIPADTSSIEDWQLLDEFLLSLFENEEGSTSTIAATCIDAGYLTGMVYEFVKNKQARRIFAVKGVKGAGRPIVSAPRKSKTGQDKTSAQVFTIGVDEAKSLLYARLRLEDYGAGFIHLPMQIDPEFVYQLLSEKAILIYDKMKNPIRRWVKTRPRNEALDCFVYGYAAIRILQPSFRQKPKLQPRNTKSGSFIR